MTLKNIIQPYLQKFLKRGVSALSYEARILFHWKILVGAFCFGTVAVLAASLFMYQDISRGDFVPIQQKSSVQLQTIKGGLLDETVRYFETKKATFDQMKKNKVASADPSR